MCFYGACGDMRCVWKRERERDSSSHGSHQLFPFSGVGVIFDVYDNDNKRNNPSIFVLENMAGRKDRHRSTYTSTAIHAVHTLVARVIH